MNMNAREAALACLLELSETDVSIASVVDNAFKQATLNGRERRLANALVYGVVRWQQQLDWVLEHFINPRFRLDVKHRAILRLGAFQLLHLDGIPPHAAIFETVQLVKNRKKTAGFINAVLRSVQRKGTELTYPSLETHPIEHIAYSLSYPKWLVKRWLNARGLSWTLGFCQASNQVVPLTFRANSLLTDRDKLCQSLKASGLSVKPSKIAPDGIVVENPSITADDKVSSSKDEISLIDLMNRPDVYVQDESAMLVPSLLMPESPKLVVDLCAAPGGKTTHIACMMENSGKIIAADISEKKLAVLAENCKRMGVQNVEIRTVDATKSDLNFINTADAVLIDAPCSGFGTLRRHPDIRWNKTYDQLRSLSDLQNRLLENAAPYIKPGGVLVYSTCTIEPTENEEGINRFLKHFPMFTLEQASEFLPDIPQSAITSKGFLQTLPHEHGVDGTFAARLRRI
ncbi:16S rRNA (cytosine(967)-C(5))-methyltransferase RsmB [Candidatus Poribacteria bacterium]|nr:MAG: 16S rRNA (cytosine(967)-C(5))-methyltransferase RsmB [Candidatus Poribacteria bacterium]